MFCFSTKLEEMKERQKLRIRPKGVSIVGLAIGKKTTIEEDLTVVRRKELSANLILTPNPSLDPIERPLQHQNWGDGQYAGAKSRQSEDCR